MSEIVEKIQASAVATLNQMVINTLGAVERQVVDQIGDFRQLTQQADTVVERFEGNMNNHFNELLDKEITRDEAVFNFETLSLVQDEELEVIVALEGMVNAARNEHLPVFISFNTRLSSLFPRKRIDESSNPLDPEQVATAFQEALRPVGLDAQNTLAVYRAFNKNVLRNLQEVLNQANNILIESKVIPDLGMEGTPKSGPERARSRPRARDDISAFGTVEEEQFEENEEQPELFSIMQNLLHTDSPAAAGQPAPATGGEIPPGMVPAGSVPAGQSAPEGAAQQQFMIPAGMVPAGLVPAEPGAAAQPGVMQPFQPQAGQQVQMVDQTQLMEILTNIQETLKQSSPGQVPESLDEVQRLDISQSLGEVLQQAAAEDNVVSAVDRQSSDIINLVTLLYEAIWQDPSVPIPIKELIGRTQITIIKVALEDVEFFNNENHPARAILNEFASAGIGWTEVEDLDKDPLYRKIQDLVERILTEFENDNELFEELIQDFRTFRAMEKAKVRHLEQRILKAKERQDRMDDIHELVTQKIAERVLGRELHPFVTELLNGPFHKFMVMLVLKEGPGGNAWKQAINTIDVLLWSVQAHEQEGDRDRLETVNPRLLNNLRKAFRIASIEQEEIDELIEQLKLVQLETFHEGVEPPTKQEAETPEAPPLELSLEEAGDNTEEQADDMTETAGLAEPVSDEGEEKGITFDAADKDETEASAAPSPDEPTDITDIQAKDADQAEDNDGELPEDDPHMMQVEALSVGIWVEFVGEEENNTRCKLAAKINAIDKYIFVNRQGVKVVEKTKMGLARELRDGTVNIISDGLLFSRALESVIGNLRESQQEQQTGSAYQPSEAVES